MNPCSPYMHLTSTPAFEASLSAPVERPFVTPTEGVHYCGYPIAELAHFPPEDIVYLLFNKELPTPEQSKAFKADMSARGACPTALPPCSTRSQPTAIPWTG